MSESRPTVKLVSDDLGERSARGAEPSLAEASEGDVPSDSAPRPRSSAEGPGSSRVILSSVDVWATTLKNAGCDATLAPEELRALRPQDEAAQLPVVDPKGYQVLGVVAQGGIGRILRARDARLGRAVALKELRAGAGPAARERFVRESLFTARLQHPSIVPLYEAGRWPSGEPFYAMKLVAGRSLADVIDGCISLDQRLALLPHVLAVAEAMAYAHSERIIHRDLKPANVLVGDFGETVVIDWGLAKDLAEEPGAPGRGRAGDFDDGTPEDAPPPPSAPREQMTLHGSIMGTPVYMPVEQATGKQVDERADVYAIGAMLYHVLAGVGPYEGEESLAVLRQVIAGPPPPLKERQRGIPDDLLTIVKKAMARDADERYPSAKELADDLRAFQTGQIVAAHRYSPMQRLRRFARRNRTSIVASATALSMLCVTAGLGISRNIEQRRLAEEREAEAQDAKQRALQRADDLTLVEARAAAERDPNEALAYLKTLSPSFSRWSEARLIAADAASRGVAIVLRGHASAINAAVFSPDGRSLVTTSDDRTVRIWDVEDRSVRVLKEHADETWRAGFVSGEFFYTTSKDRTLRLWSTVTGESRVLGSVSSPMPEVASAGGAIAGVIDGGGVRLWDWVKGESRSFDHDVAQRSAALSADGARLALGGNDGSVRLRDVRSGEEKTLSEAHGEATLALAFSPDGKALAAKSDGGAVRVWEIASGQSRLLLDRVPAARAHASGALAFSPDGAHLASTGEDELVRVWDTATWRARLFAGHESRVVPLAFSPDSRLLATGSVDHTARIWDVERGDARVVRGFEDTVSAVAFSPSGRALAAASDDTTVRVVPVTLEANRVLAPAMPPLDELDVAPNGKRLLAAGMDGALRVWDLGSLESIALVGHQGAVSAARFSPSSDLVVSTGVDGTTRVFGVSGASRHVFQDGDVGASDRKLALSRDGRFAATASKSGVIYVHDLEATVAWTLLGHRDQVTSLSFSPSANVLVSTSEDGTMRFWDVAAGTSSVFPSQAPVFVAELSPSGTTVLSGGADHQLHLRDLVSGTERAIHTGGLGPQQIAVSGDGALAITADVSSTALNVWDLFRLRPRRTLRGHSSDVTRFAVSPDGRRVASASLDKTVRLWDVASGESRVLRGHAQEIADVVFSPDGQLIASAGADGAVRLWADDLPHDGEALRAWLDDATPDTIELFRRPAEVRRP